MDRFSELYQKHIQAVFRFIVSCVSRRDIAEEITSEAFLALFRNLKAIDESQLPGWLITVARNRARDYWRRQLLEQKHLSNWEDAPAVFPDLDEGWLLEIRDLKPVHRLCLTLRYVEGMSRAEIAQATGLSETQVKGYLQYSLQLLRSALADRNEMERK
jgi:RNA polymerase sigma-70 factor, ECF subfamily